jgi:hypothetical protein
MYYQDSHDHDYTNLEDCFLRNNVVDERVTQADLEREYSYVLRWIRFEFESTSCTNRTSGELIAVLVSSLAKQGDWAVTLCDLDYQADIDKLIVLRPIDGRPGYFSCLGPAIFVNERNDIFPWPSRYNREETPSSRDKPKEELERLSLV